MNFLLDSAITFSEAWQHQDSQIKISCERTNKRWQADPVQIFDVKSVKVTRHFMQIMFFSKWKNPFRNDIDSFYVLINMHLFLYKKKSFLFCCKNHDAILWNIEFQEQNDDIREFLLMNIPFELLWNSLQSYNRSVKKYEDSYLALTLRVI